MHTIWLIARYEYGRHVRRRAFLWTVFGIPLLIAIVMGVVIAVALTTSNEQRIGLVDEAGIIVSHVSTSPSIPIERYATEQDARAALEQGTLDVYVVVPPDYLAQGDVRAVGRRALSDEAEGDVRALLEDNLLRSVPAPNQARAAQPMELALRTPGGGREIGADSALLFFLPYAFAILFVMTTFTTSGYLIQALTEEKEDRVIEILATSVRPEHMMTGKILGLSAVGATQMLVWVSIPLAIALTAAPNLLALRSLDLPWTLLVIAAVYFALGYLLIATSYATIGAAVTTPQEAQSFVAPISLVAVAPLLLLTVILGQPNGVVAVVLSIFPLTAAMTMLMRLPIADIPPWQIATSLVLLVATTLGAVWLSTHVMRLGMLRFNQRLRLGEIFRRGV